MTTVSPGYGRTVAHTAPEGGDQRPRRQLVDTKAPAEKAFLGLTRGSALIVLAVITLVGVFLAIRAAPALKVAKFSFFTTQAWQPDIHRFGIAGIMTGTVLIAFVAVAIAIPVALGLSLFITEVAPAQIKRTLVSLVDLMAAVPSVVYGLWALEFLQNRVVGVSRWIATWFGWFPLFHVNGADPSNPVQSGTLYSASTFIVGIAVSLMVIPILCSVMRETFSQAPLGEREGAYALGATRWGMIRSVVLPFGKGGIIGGTMLGLGRALGETIVVILIISPVYNANFHILQSGATRCRASSPISTASPPPSGPPRRWPPASPCSPSP